jgi:hypothetical protein
MFTLDALYTVIFVEHINYNVFGLACVFGWDAEPEQFRYRPQINDVLLCKKC